MSNKVLLNSRWVNVMLTGPHSENCWLITFEVINLELLECHLLPHDFEVIHLLILVQVVVLDTINKRSDESFVRGQPAFKFKLTITQAKARLTFYRFTHLFSAEMVKAGTPIFVVVFVSTQVDHVAF